MRRCLVCCGAVLLVYCCTWMLSTVFGGDGRLLRINVDVGIRTLDYS
jgi:hypothetical protein